MKSKEFLPGQREILLVFNGGDDVMASLTGYANEHGIRGARLHGIGGFARATVAYWNKETKVYEEIAVDEQVEVLSLAGSLATSGEEVKVHAHVVLGRRDGSALGGHLLRATVFPTLELFIIDAGTRLVRAKDPSTGLMLLQL